MQTDFVRLSVLDEWKAICQPTSVEITLMLIYKNLIVRRMTRSAVGSILFKAFPKVVSVRKLTGGNWQYNKLWKSLIKLRNGQLFNSLTDEEYDIIRAYVESINGMYGDSVNFESRLLG